MNIEMNFFFFLSFHAHLSARKVIVFITTILVRCSMMMVMIVASRYESLLKISLFEMQIHK